MRVNVYSEEMTNRIQIISKEIDGQTFTGLRFYLELPVTQYDSLGEATQISGPFMHHRDDDDSSAVTFWGKQDLRGMLRRALEMLDAHYIDPAKGIEELLSIRCRWDPDKMTIEELAREFVWEPENWEGYEELKKSTSFAVPPEFMALAQAVEKKYGPMPIDKENV